MARVPTTRISRLPQTAEKPHIRVLYAVTPPPAEVLFEALDAELASRYPPRRLRGLPLAALRRLVRIGVSSPPRRRRAILLAEIGEDTVGCVVLFHDEPGFVELGRMYVLPEWRGAGVADELVERAEETARALGCHRIRLETGKAQPEAVALYTHRGYQPAPRWGRYRRNFASLCFAKTL